MANIKISELSASTSLTGSELIPVVQSGSTKKTTVNDISNYIIAKEDTVSSGDSVDMSNSAYDDAKIIHLVWSGANGTATYTLPAASSSTNRVIRFISDSTFNTNTRVDLTPAGSDTLDGSATAYEINKAYEGIAIWSDGSEWFIIQKKA